MSHIKMSMPLELCLINDDKKTVEYLVEFEVFPGSPGKSYGPPEKCYPPEAPEISDFGVYFEEEHNVCTCQVCDQSINGNCVKKCGCNGTTARKKIKKVRRPELDALVSEDELYEYFQNNPPVFDEPEYERDDD